MNSAYPIDWHICDNITIVQICWTWQKVRSQDDRGFQQFLDRVEYSQKSILRYERVYGPGFVSTGGLGMPSFFFYPSITCYYRDPYFFFELTWKNGLPWLSESVISPYHLTGQRKAIHNCWLAVAVKWFAPWLQASWENGCVRMIFPTSF